ncbi:protease B nonderepressible form [Acarospora aff. strigata]|nr:protease B nonderepressible form [Acarospora aff. strigata]
MLGKVFGDQIKCQNPEETFSRLSLLSERFASSSAWQYHHLLPSLLDVVTYVEQKICPPTDQRCRNDAHLLRSASYLDVDYDAISQVVTLGAFWYESPSSPTWDEQMQISEAANRIEVGVLANETPTEPEELSLGGFLTVIGEDEKPNPTLFSFPSRHHPLVDPPEHTYSSSFITPTGLHPTLRLTFPASAVNAPAPTCALHTYLTLPSSLFADRYQLSDPVLLSSNNLRSVHSLTGETDLEAPDWTVKQWGSSMLLELSPPMPRKLKSQTWHADIPLHLRYLPPTPGGFAEVHVPWPVVFWACTAEEGTKMSVNPFDRANLGYDGLFGPRTMFYHLQPTAVGNGNGSLVETLRVPVLDAGKTEWVERGTVVVVLLGFLWVCWRLGVVWWVDGSGEGMGERREERASKKRE